ncbi:unnamed protein product [Didymodactylos carnosus]|uniref:Uncharacterized protein n=1 Tax=Didymodactylos carnosus TaxID=1234261 RepID=A0A814Y7I9_9BILA|nr:unnamed protein product [Didymodactylos carnosus]CAF1598540.1 unnamed protein product [Didymodactylos carnosus]CAF3988452.1 unnamed protein product [Didymodactylos carnosus]CAF4405975.1 unnamed protein product [Didymodactylos carnosus]
MKNLVQTMHQKYTKITKINIVTVPSRYDKPILNKIKKYNNLLKDTFANDKAVAVVSIDSERKFLEFDKLHPNGDGIDHITPKLKETA